MKIADQLKICGEATEESVDGVITFIITARTKYPEALRLIEVLREALIEHNRANDYMKEYGKQIDAQEDVHAGFVRAYSLNAKALAAIEEFEKESGK